MLRVGLFDKTHRSCEIVAHQDDDIALKVYDKLLNVKLPTYSIYMGYNLEWNQEATNPPPCYYRGFLPEKEHIFPVWPSR